MSGQEINRKLEGVLETLQELKKAFSGQQFESRSTDAADAVMEQDSAPEVPRGFDDKWLMQQAKESITRNACCKLSSQSFS